MMKKGANYQMSVGFTIQNVSIKSLFLVFININFNDLQYKMFLLNAHPAFFEKSFCIHLQYKMFLLNK